MDTEDEEGGCFDAVEVGVYLVSHRSNGNLSDDMRYSSNFVLWLPALWITYASAIEPIVVKGNHFFYKESGEAFFVSYQSPMRVFELIHLHRLAVSHTNPSR